MAHICVGIDLGSYNVKVAEMEVSSRGFKLTRLTEYPLSQDPNHDRRIELIDLLLRLSNQYNHEIHFIFGIQQRLVSLRQCHFPFRERHKILKSVAFELEDDIPFTPEDAIFDVKVLQYKKNQSEVIAVVCPKAHIQNLMELCHDGSVQPHIVSVEGLATANLFSRWIDSLGEEGHKVEEEDTDESPSKHPAHVILQMGHTSTLLMIFKGEVLFDVRNIDFGGQSVAEVIANTYKIQPTEAGRELREKSYILLNDEGATRDQIIFSDVIKKSFHDFSTQVRLTLLEKQTRFNLKYNEILITGGLSQIRNIGPYLTQHLEIPTNRLGNLSVLPEMGTEIDTSSLTWGATAIGLAMEGFRKPKDPAINLLKGEFANKSDGFQRHWERWSHTVKVVAVALVLLFIFAVVRNQLAQSIDEQARVQMKKQAKTIAGLKGRQASEGKIRKLVKEKKKFKKSLDSVQKIQKLNLAMHVLKRISEATPTRPAIKINVRGLKITHTKVTIEGEIRDPTHLTTFVKSLQTIAKNKQVKKWKSSLRPRDGKRVFGYEFQVDLGEGT